MPKLTAEDKKWREEDDARTLAEAEAIKKNKARMSGAQRGAKRLYNQKKEEANTLGRLAKKTAPPKKKVAPAKKKAKKK